LKRIPTGAVRASLRTGLFGLAALSAGCAGIGGGLSEAPVPPRPPAAAVAPAVPPAPIVSSAPAPGPAATPAQPPVVQRPTPALVAPQAIEPPPAAEAAPLLSPGPPLQATVAHRDLWARIRAGFAMPELDTPLVQEKERFYLSKPDALQRMFERGGRYLHFIVEEVEKRGMPTELALLPFVESAMNPVALSPAKAAGLWQFIPSTGRQYELSQNWWVDNRRDVLQSTRAALEYLAKIHEMHDRDWFLALASYNWGENAVARAVKNNRARGRPTDYLSLSMPAETRHYVPKLIALKHIILRSDALGVALPELPNKPYFATIEKTRPIDLKLAAQFAGMRVEEFVALNPAHNRPVIAASRNNEINLPADRVAAFTAALDRHERENRPLASWQPYTLKPGESLEDVARRAGVTPVELLRANGLSGARNLLPGSQLITPQASVKDERQVESFEGPRVYERIAVGAVYHRVQRSDTLPRVAASYRISVEQLREWNSGVKAIRPGTTLLVRPAASQTVLTSADGSRQVIARAAPPPAPVAEAVDRPARAANAPVTSSAHSKAPPTRTASAPTRKPAPVAKASGVPTSVKTVYKPPRAAPRTSAKQKGGVKRPRT
jgi:membrane-bound lytic murein transglycosylase D